METHDIENMIRAQLQDATVTVTGDGRHFEALVISKAFEGMTLLARQRLVYSALGNNLIDGTIHALSIKARTPDETDN